MLAISTCPEAIDDGGNLVQISEIKRRVGADGQSDTMRRQRDPIDQIIDGGALRAAALDAVIDGDFKHIETVEV